MVFRLVKCLLVAIFGLLMPSFFIAVSAQENNHRSDAIEQKEEKKSFDANEVIFGHIMDAHEFHFFSYKSSDGKEHHASIPLPVILYSPQKGFSIFMSSVFHHGHETHNGYALLTGEKIAQLKLDPKKYNAGQIVPVNQNGEIESSVKVYDISLTRNVVQMIIALALLVWIMVSVAKRYKTGQGITSAPKGLQNLIEPVITFVRDEVAKPNLGRRYKKYF
ncbi:MAG: F0F1 ATP synthase subunit A, partial [Bacteroidota bacterium]|nr:F0F1 ATP synthase subunit A [Bacteroidota bacterium]